MNPQHTDDVPTTVESAASSSYNMAAESPTTTQATSGNDSFNYNAEYNTVLPTNAPVKRLIRKITHIDPKKLQEAGLDRKIAEAIRKQKLQVDTSIKTPQTTVSCNKLDPTISSSVIKSIETTTMPTRPCSSSTVTQSAPPIRSCASPGLTQSTPATRPCASPGLTQSTPPTRPCASPTVTQPTAPLSPTVTKPVSTKTIIPPKITITAPEALNETDRRNMEGLSPQQRLKQVKHLLNQKLLLKKISNQPGMSVHLKPPAATAPLSPKSKQLPTKLITMSNTPPQTSKGFIHLIEPSEERTPNKPVIKNKPPQKSPQDVARNIHFPSEDEKPNLIQYIRKNPMKFLTKNDNQTSYTHSNKLSESMDDIPKASIKPANPNLNNYKKQLMVRRQKIDYPEASHLKIPQESLLPTIDTFKKPYPIPDSNYYQLQNETQSDSGFKPTENYETPPPTIPQIPNHGKEDLIEAPSASPNCLIVLENKILSQDEMIDLTALRLSTSNTPQRFARPHKPIPEVIIKQEKLDDFPTTAAATVQNTNTLASAQVQKRTENLTNSKGSGIEMVHLPAKQNKKIIVNAQKLKLPQEKIAELAKIIAQSTATKTKPQKQIIPINKDNNFLELKSQLKINAKAIYKRKTVTNDKKPELLHIQRNEVSCSSQTSTTTSKVEQWIDNQNSKPNWSNRVTINKTKALNETQTSISTANLMQQQPTMDQNQIVMVKQEPTTSQILPAEELPKNVAENQTNSSVIQPLPPLDLKKVLTKSQLTNNGSSSTQFSSSFSDNRKPAVEIVDELSDSEDCFSAVDFVAAFANTNPITVNTTLELSPEELNLSASCAMSLSTLCIAPQLPHQRIVSIPQRQLNIPTTSCAATSSQYIPNDGNPTEIGKIVDVNTVDIDSRFALGNSKNMNTIVIQSSNGAETIKTKTTDNKLSLITIPANKLRPVKILNVIDSKKMSLEKSRDMEMTKNIIPKESMNTSEASTTFSNNKVKSNKLENVLDKESDVLGKAKEHVDRIVDKAETNLLTEESNNTTEKHSKKIVCFKSDGASDKLVSSEYLKKDKEEYVQPTESKTKADDPTQTNVSAKIPINSPEKSVTFKTIINTALPTEMDQQSVDIITEKNLSNNTSEKSLEMTTVMPLDKSVQTFGKTTDKSVENIMPTNLEMSTEMTIKPLEISIQTPNNSTDTSVENIIQTNYTAENLTEMTVKPLEKSKQTPNDSTEKSVENALIPAWPTEKEKNVILESSKSKDSNPIVTVDDTNTTTKDLSSKSSVKSPVKSPEKSINLKSILKLTQAVDAPQQHLKETSGTMDIPSQDLNVIISKETPLAEVCETTKSDEPESIQEAEPTKTNESNSNNTVPSKRISRFKKGKINLVTRNKPGAVMKKAIPTSGDIKVGNEEKNNKADIIKGDGSLSGTASNLKKSECVTGEIIVGNDNKAHKEDKVEKDDSLSEIGTKSKSECLTGEVIIGNEDNADKEDKLEIGDSLCERSTSTKSECLTTNKTMEEKTMSNENKITDCTLNIDDKITERSTQVSNTLIDNPEPQTIDIKTQEDKLNDSPRSISNTKNPAVSAQNETVISKDDNADSNVNTTEAGKEETEPKKDIRGTEDGDLNSDKTATYSKTNKVIVENPSESIELSSEDDHGKGEDETSKAGEIAPKEISQVPIKPPITTRESEAQNLEGLTADSVQVLESLKKSKICLVNIVQHSSKDMTGNLPKIPFKRKCSEAFKNREEEALPKGIKTLLKIKKSVELANKNVENEKGKTEENETNLLMRSNESKESTSISSTQLKKSKTNESKFESDVSGEEPATSGIETKRKMGRPSMQKADKEKANENSKNQEQTRNSDDGRRSLRLSLNSKPETATTTAPTPSPPLPPPSPPKTRHSSRHQISDDLEFLPVNAEIKKFRATKARKSLNDNCNIKENSNQSASEKSKRKRLSPKSMETDDSKRTRLPSQTMETNVICQDKEKVAKLTPTVTLTKRGRISSETSEMEDNNPDEPGRIMEVSSQNKLPISYHTKRKRFSSQSSETEAKNRDDSSCNTILTHTPFDILKRPYLAAKPTDPEDSSQESPHEVKMSHTKQRKKLRKTFEDIKKSSQKPHPDTDSDEDYRDFDTMKGLEDEHEFLGFDENSVASTKLQRNKEQANADNQSQLTSTMKATKGGTLKNWLTTGKAISPTFSKDPHVNRRHDDILIRGKPLKKRWDLAANLNEETDITDDTSPADDEDEGTSVRYLKNVINSNTDKLGSKKIKLNKTKPTNHTFLEPRPVATKSNADTDSDCQELSTQMSSKKSISFNKDKNTAQVSETHKSLNIPATQNLLTQDIYDSKTKAQCERSKTAENSKNSLLKEPTTQKLSCVGSKQRQLLAVKLNDKKVSFEDFLKNVNATVESINKTLDSSRKSRSSKAKSYKQAKASLAPSDFSTENESNNTQDVLTKSGGSQAKSKKQDNTNRVTDFSNVEDSSKDDSSSSKSKKKIPSEDALDIAIPSQLDSFSHKEISLKVKTTELFQAQEIPSKTKKTKKAKGKDQLIKADKDSDKTESKESLMKEINTDAAHKTPNTSVKHQKTNSSKKQEEKTASDLSKNLIELEANVNNSLESLITSKKSKTSKEKIKAVVENPESTKEKTTLTNKETDTNKETVTKSSLLNSSPKSTQKPLKIQDSDEECSPQLPKKRGRKRKIVIVEDTFEDDSAPHNQNSKNSKILDNITPITTPHLEIIKNDSSTDISTPSKKRKPYNVDTTTVSFNPRLLLITKREQIDTDEILTEPNPGTGPIQCGLCLKRTTSAKWTLHLAEHYGVGWQVGKPKLNVENRNTVFANITSYFKTTEIKGLSCRMCEKLYRSALGLMIHLESCGTPALRLICEYCKKDYSKLSMPIHLRSCPERTKLEKSLSEKVMTSEEPQEEVFSNTGRLKRHSTIKAESILKVIGAELEQNTEQTKEFEPKDHLRFVPPLDTEEVHTKWSQDLEKFGRGFCPKKICKFNSPHLEQLEKHIQQCKFIKTGYFCNFCRRACFATEEIALDHISNSHKPGQDQSDDSECDLKAEAEQSSDDDNDLSEGVDEGETDNEGADEDVDDEKDYSQRRRVKKKVRSNYNRSLNPSTVSCANRKRVYEPRCFDLNKEVLGKWKNFLSLNYSSEPLFSHLTSHYSIEKNQDFAKYLPSQASSMNFSLEKQYKLNTAVGVPNPNIEWQELKRFESIENKSEIFYFLGAPVKFCTWVPLPADVEEQYILVGYRKEMFNFVKFSQPKSHHTVLMIFKVTQEKKIPKLEIHYGIIINDGPVHGVQFLPSGGYDRNTNRLGLVAVATVNPAIKVYSLPIEVEIEECNKIENVTLIDIKANFELNFDVMDQGKTDHVVMKPQCLEICWSEFSGHNHIFASYSNGFIGIWDITDDPQENLNRFVVENVVCYATLNYFYIGEKGSNCIAVHYDTNGPRWLAISAKYRKFVIYDIHNFMQPVIIKEECNKNILRSLNWSPVWGPMLAGFCDSIPNNGRCICSINANNILFPQQRFESMVSAVSYIHYSPVTNLLVSTADNGDILFADPREIHYDDVLGKKFGLPRRILSSMDVKQLDNNAIVRPPLKQSTTDVNLPSDWTVHEPNYNVKYGLVFNPPFKLKEQHKNKYYNANRRAPLNITPLMRINTLRCNLNFSAKRLVAAGYENGFMRIIHFNKDTQFSNWK